MKINLIILLGKYFYQDGGVYFGEWVNSQCEGFGMLFYPSGKIAYEGNNDDFNLIDLMVYIIDLGNFQMHLNDNKYKKTHKPQSNYANLRR